MAATPLAFRVSEILMKYCPKIMDVKFTRELEAMMEQIELGKEIRQHVVQSTIEYLKPILRGFEGEGRRDWFRTHGNNRADVDGQGYVGRALSQMWARL